MPLHKISEALILLMHLRRAHRSPVLRWQQQLTAREATELQLCQPRVESPQRREIKRVEPQLSCHLCHYMPTLR